MSRNIGCNLLKNHVIGIILCSLVGSLSIVSCSEWDSIRRSLAEASMSKNTSWIYARLIDQNGNKIVNEYYKTRWAKYCDI